MIEKDVASIAIQKRGLAKAYAPSIANMSSAQFVSLRAFLVKGFYKARYKVSASSNLIC